MRELVSGGAAVLCWFSRGCTDPRCSTDAPGLMLHRALELLRVQIWYRFGMSECPEILGKGTRSFQSARTAFPGGKGHV